MDHDAIFRLGAAAALHIAAKDQHADSLRAVLVHVDDCIIDFIVDKLPWSIRVEEAGFVLSCGDRPPIRFTWWTTRRGFAVSTDHLPSAPYYAVRLELLRNADVLATSPTDAMGNMTVALYKFPPELQCDEVIPGTSVQIHAQSILLRPDTFHFDEASLLGDATPLMFLFVPWFIQHTTNDSEQTIHLNNIVGIRIPRLALIIATYRDTVIAFKIIRDDETGTCTVDASCPGYVFSYEMGEENGDYYVVGSINNEPIEYVLSIDQGKCYPVGVGDGPALHWIRSVRDLFGVIQ